MRKITIRLTDYDEIDEKEIIVDFEACLVSPTIAIYSDKDHICFNYFNEPIPEDVELISTKDVTFTRSIVADGGVFGDIPIDMLPNLTVAELAVLMK